jgi:hypothetical protein
LAEWDWRSYAAAILGSGLVVFIVTTLYSTLVNKPIINIDLSKNDTIEVTNKGLAPATHLMLTIYSNAEMTNFTIFSSENITQSAENITQSAENITHSVPQNSSAQILRIQTARLASGEGSNITIDMSKSNTTDPTIFATYDQGSIRHPRNAGIYQDYLSNLPLIVASIGAILSLIYLIEQKSKNDMLRFMSAKVYRDVREVVKKIESDPYYDEKLIGDQQFRGGGMYSNKLWANPKFEGMKVKFFNKEDLDKLYKFFANLIERDSAIKAIELSLRDPLGARERSHRIHDANDKLNRAAKCAYENISWEKYAGFKFIKLYLLGGVDPKLKVKFRMFITVKDQKYAFYQLMSIGVIVGIAFYPALLSQLPYIILAGIVYILTAVLLYLLWKRINSKEVRRSVRERFEIEMEKERGKIGELTKDKKEDIDPYVKEAVEELKELRAKKDSLEKQSKQNKETK